MVEIRWLIKRLKAMSVPEMTWRLAQKGLERREARRFERTKTSVTERIFHPKLAALVIRPERLCLAYDIPNCKITRTMPLLANFDYERYRMDWHACFQTDGHWPLAFCHSSLYKQSDGIGDPRTNWELNRHFQFALLAKDYYVTSETAYLDELWELFASWNQENPFLWGISWTSAMEIAIRVSNWCYAYAFLARAKQPPQELLEKLRIGIVNMTDYVARHYSRYSSANNHLIVEAYAIGQSGILLGYQPWIHLAVSLFTRELPLQNHTDGVNREQSLHYQAFSMEAIGLMIRLIVKNGMELPKTWFRMLEKQSRYLACCMGSGGETIGFGDNDEGKILDLCGGFHHNRYVLELFSCLLGERYTDLNNCTENIRWLFSESELLAAQKKKLYETKRSVCFHEGGHSILRSNDGRIMIGIDHAELGYGNIAAHGHADALSFQMFVDGEAIFVDPGTYLYGYHAKARDAYRKTENHNTVCINGRDQSEMLGPFLWGRKAVCTLKEVVFEEQGDVIEAEHDGYLPIRIRRRFAFDRKRTLVITDTVEGIAEGIATFVLAPEARIVMLDGSTARVETAKNILCLTAEGSGTEPHWEQRGVSISEQYGVECPSAALMVCFSCDGHMRLETTIQVEERGN